MVWKFNNKPVPNEVPEGFYGFIYEIEMTDGKKYIGAKNFFRKVTMGRLKGDRANAKRRVKYVESNWRTYDSSSKKVAASTIKSKNILRLCNDSLSLRYWEQYYLMVNHCILSDNYLNDNVGGKYFKDKVKVGAIGEKPR